MDTRTLDELATGVVLLDADLRVGFANAAFAELSGFGNSRLVGANLAQLPPDGGRLHAAAAAARDGRTTVRVHAATLCADPGRDATLDFTLTAASAGVVVEAHPSAATMANPVSRSLRGFAHEIRNPLAAISGAAQLLEQGGDARQRELARLVGEEAARLAALSARMLGARRVLASRAANVHAVLERAAELVGAEGASVALVRDYDPSLPAWYGDPDRLLQAVLNLVRNAVQAHARRIVLRSRAEAGWRDANGHGVPALRVEVEDDGDGVPAALVRSLFEPMVSGRADGTGLGLALAREIAREHGGELDFRPRPHGACFVLRLPRRGGASTVDRAPAGATA
jgi:two-component system nitrogen regulation sensor histidine kinase GlnL